MKFKSVKIVKKKDTDIFFWSKTLWFGGLFSLKLWHPYKTFVFRFLFIPVFYCVQKKDKICYKLFGIPILKLKKGKTFFKNFCIALHKLYPQYDDFYIFMSKSGEFFLLMHHFMEWLRRNNSKNYVCVFFNNYHANLYKIFFPNHKFISVKEVDVVALSRGVENVKNVIDKCNFYVPFYEKYFRQVEQNIRRKQGHYYLELLKHLDLENTSTTAYTVSEPVKEKIKKILPLLNNKFIFISPESGSNALLPKDFWEEICNYAQSLGYEVFCNCTHISNLLKGSICCFLTYEETIELAKHAQLIIGLRSGLLECIASPSVPLVAIYTDFPKRSGFKFLSSKYIKAGFSLKKLKCIGKLNTKEYDLNEMSEEELLKKCKNDVLSVVNRR